MSVHATTLFTPSIQHRPPHASDLTTTSPNIRHGAPSRRHLRPFHLPDPRLPSPQVLCRSFSAQPSQCRSLTLAQCSLTFCYDHSLPAAHACTTPVPARGQEAVATRIPCGLAGCKKASILSASASAPGKLAIIPKCAGCGASFCPGSVESIRASDRKLIR